MRQNIRTRGTSSEKTVKDIRRATRKQYSAEEKIRIVLDGLRGEETIAELCRQESINNLTPADVYFGRGQAILNQRERIKRKTIETRRLHHRKYAA
jgi:hypothetical protein